MWIVPPSLCSKVRAILMFPCTFCNWENFFCYNCSVHHIHLVKVLCYLFPSDSCTNKMCGLFLYRLHTNVKANVCILKTSKASPGFQVRIQDFQKFKGLCMLCWEVADLGFSKGCLWSAQSWLKTKRKKNFCQHSKFSQWQDS